MAVGKIDGDLQPLRRDAILSAEDSGGDAAVAPEANVGPIRKEA